ncbi:MAG: tRNA (guanosine(37)-N1)-methyltransferase TrmD [Pigmentiphaga sp.]
MITLFPEFFGFLTGFGVSGRAHARGLWHLQAWNPRDFTHDAHRTIDDRPYGGGPGMVMLAQPLESALHGVRTSRNDAGADVPGRQVPVILLSPAGQRYGQPQAQTLANSTGAIFVCGRYEGVDQRFIDRHVTDEWSLGDFVLSGGEPALLAMLDAAVRLLPGALNHGESARQDSFDAALSGLLDCPHYSRPEQWQDESVPEVLLSGHHQRIQAWRRQQSLRLTALRRPELIAAARAAGRLSRADEACLAALAQENGNGPI